jgi:hypothetical protein
VFMCCVAGVVQQQLLHHNNVCHLVYEPDSVFLPAL